MRPVPSAVDSTPQIDRRILASLGLSLVLHVLFLGLHVGPRPLPDRPSGPAQNRLDIRLNPNPRPVSPDLSVSTQTRSTSALASSPRITRRRPDETIKHHPATTDQGGASTVERSPNDESTAPSSSIDYAAAHEIARQSARSLHDPAAPKIELQTTPATESETVLGHRIKQTAHPDCRTRYAGAGLLAIPLLINDAVRDGGCKW